MSTLSSRLSWSDLSWEIAQLIVDGARQEAYRLIHSNNKKEKPPKPDKDGRYKSLSDRCIAHFYDTIKKEREVEDETESDKLLAELIQEQERRKK